MAILEVKVEEIKNSRGKVTAYKLVDGAGGVMNVNPQSLITAIKGNKIKCNNAFINKAGKLEVQDLVSKEVQQIVKDTIADVKEKEIKKDNVIVDNTNKVEEVAKEKVEESKEEDKTVVEDTIKVEDKEEVNKHTVENKEEAVTVEEKVEESREEEETDKTVAVSDDIIAVDKKDNEEVINDNFFDIFNSHVNGIYKDENEVNSYLSYIANTVNAFDDKKYDRFVKWVDATSKALADNNALVTQLNRWWTNSVDGVAFDNSVVKEDICTWAIISGVGVYDRLKVDSVSYDDIKHIESYTMFNGDNIYKYALNHVSRDILTRK